MESDFSLLRINKNQDDQKRLIKDFFSLIQINESSQKGIKALKCPYQNCGEIYKQKISDEKLQKFSNKDLTCFNCEQNFTFWICPLDNCKKIITFTDKDKKSDIYFTCPYCENNFAKLNCPQCDFYHFLNPEEIKDSERFICKNLKCLESFYLSECVSCKFNNLFFVENFDENFSLFNKLIKCEKCGKKYTKIKCPCGEISYEKDNNYFEGLSFKCQNLKCDEEQKIIINCLSCNFINFYKKNEINSNEIKCLNEKCNKIQQIIKKIECPLCHTLNEFINFEEDIECKLITCINNSCGNKFTFYKCVFCFDFIFWNSKDKDNKDSLKMLKKNSENFSNYISGQTVNCGNCNKISSKIECPFCFDKQIFYNQNYNKIQDARNFLCLNFSCQKNFYFNSCPNCHEHAIVKNKRNSRELLKCPSEKNLCKNYDYIKCQKCRNLFYFFEEEFIKYKILKCPKEFCQEKFVIFYCECGSKKILLEENLKGIFGFLCPDIDKECENFITYCDVCNYFFDELNISEDFPKEFSKFICLNKNCENFFNKENLIETNINQEYYKGKGNNFLEGKRSFNILRNINYKNGLNSVKPQFLLMKNFNKNFINIENVSENHLKLYYKNSKNSNLYLLSKFIFTFLPF